jgi:hypothetical protein
MTYFLSPTSGDVYDYIQRKPLHKLHFRCSCDTQHAYPLQPFFLNHLGLQFPFSKVLKTETGINIPNREKNLKDTEIIASDD